MFDFIRKRINKTIKDASDAIPEEELENEEEIQESEEKEETTDKLEESNDNDESELNEDTKDKTNDEEDKEEDTKEEKKGRFSFFRRNKDKNKKEEKENAQDDDTQEDITEEKEETTTDLNQEEDTSEDDDDKEDEDTKEEKKGMFSFFRRNKDEDKKEETNEEETDEITEETEDTSEEVSEDIEETPKEEETTEDDTEVEDKTENKGRFGFFSRNKNEDKKEDSDKDEEKEDSSKKDEEDSGRFSFITKKTIKEDDVEDILEELEFSLIEGDVAFDVAEKIVESVKEDLIGRKIKRRGDMELFTTDALKSAITEIINNGYYDLLGDIEKSKEQGEPYKIMFVGINGTGKTTTIAKMATYLEKHGYSSVFGASDTFRAGAIEQLEHHANNLNLKIIKHERNSDPAAVAYDAVEHARATNKDVVLIDTSGRMQTNANLMDEMKKIKRVSQPDIVIYVGDALMGNDATEQASKFNEVIDIDGIILTKADADAKGGAAISIGHVIHKPILFIGTGQSYEDLMEFKPEWMINQIFNEEAEA